MKLIEGLKEIERLKKKLDDLRNKVGEHCAHSSLKQPEYGNDQQKMVDKWIQSYHDTVQRILDLRIAIAQTNLNTDVTIELGGKQVTKSIAEWIHRRRELANLDANLYRTLNDKHVNVGKIRTVNPSMGAMQTDDNDEVDVTSVRYYDPEVRDTKLELYDSEPSIIDGKLEIVNAVTDIEGITE